MSLNGDWERSSNSNGLPYYLNHVTEETSWNHPVISRLEHNLGSFNKIKYAAYRTAAKLRAIQKEICGCNLEISTIMDYFDNKDSSEISNLKQNVTPTELEKILNDLFLHQANKSNNLTKDPLLAAELMLNWILNIHDRARRGVMKFLSVKLTLIIICAGSQRQKYYYMFSQMQNDSGYIDRNILGFFLQACLKIPKYLGEQLFFGDASIEPAIKNLFEQAINPRQAISSDFVNWVLAEPQPLVWIPTLYRLAASETTKHDAKCNICKVFPMIGFRYKCVQCFNFDLCQECFWTGRIAKTHKLNHPTQEYCRTSSQSSDLKDFQKMFKNKVMKALRRKKHKDSKKRFTEIPPDQQSIKSSHHDYEEDNHSEPSNYQAASEYGEDANDGLQNNKSVEQEFEPSSWDPQSQPYKRSQSQESLPTSSVDNDYSSLQREQRDMKPKISPLSDDQNREMEYLLSSLEDDNRKLQSEIDSIRNEHEHQISENSGLAQDNSVLKLEKRRMEERQGMLEEHNRQLEMQMQKLRLLLQQQKEDLLTMIDIKDMEKRPKLNSAVSANIVLPAAPTHERDGALAFRRRPLQPHQNTTLLQFQPPTVKRLRIPTTISFKNSRISPVYEVIKEDEPLAERTRRNAWEDDESNSELYTRLSYSTNDARREFRDMDSSFGDSNVIFENSGAVGKGLKENNAFLGNSNVRSLKQCEKSPEEQQLDRTVQWAMSNFQLSETDSCC